MFLLASSQGSSHYWCFIFFTVGILEGRCAGFGQSSICEPPILKSRFLGFPYQVTYEHGFKNQTDQRTGKESGYWLYGPIEVGPVVEPVTS